jgi:hypothetical protein
MHGCHSTRTGRAAADTWAVAQEGATAAPRAAPEQGPRLHEGAVAELWAAAEQRAVA